MNNTERLAWLSILILGSFFYENQVSKIESLELLSNQIEISSSIKDDQILDLTQRVDEVASQKYSEGFEFGRTQAMIASINNSNIFDYKDGYHAALSQFNFSASIHKEEIIELLSNVDDTNEKSSDLYLKLSTLVK